MSIVGIALLLLVVMLAALAGAGYAMYRLVVIPNRRTAKYVVSQEFRPDDIIRRQRLVTFLGRESTGRAPRDSFGELVLSAEKLWFFDANSATTLDMPLAHIREAALVDSHLGVRTGRPLLLLRFDTADGPDGAAFHLLYPDEWRLAIDNVRSKP